METKYSTLSQIVAVTIKNFAIVSFGLTMGFPTILIPNLVGDNPNETIHLNKEQISWIGSIMLLCIPMGCLLTGVTQPIGRKRSIQLVCIPFLCCWIAFIFASEVWHIFLALGLSGFLGGFVETPILSYVAETTQPRLRGMLSATGTMSMMLGIILQFVLGSFCPWRKAAMISCITPALAFSLLFLLPESPYWYLMYNKPDEARKSLAWLRGWTTTAQIEEEFQQMVLDYNKSKNIKNSIDISLVENCNRIDDEKIELTSRCSRTLNLVKPFGKESFFWPFSLIMFMFIILNFTGSQQFQTYAVVIFSTFQSPINQYYATICLGIVELLGSMVCVIFVSYLGKRTLTFASLIVSAVCNLIIATYAYLAEIEYLNFQKYTDNIESNSLHWIPMVFLILMAFGAHSGMRVLPWILIGEVYSHKTRGVACGLSGGTSYLLTFVANKIFLNMVETLTLPGIFWFFAAVGIFGLVTLYFILPETEGKTLLQISDHFNRSSKLSNSTSRKQNKT